MLCRVCCLSIRRQSILKSCDGCLQVKNLERRTEEDVAYTAVAKYLVSVLPRFQQMSRREQVSLSQDEPDEELPEESRQERRYRYGRRNSDRR